SIRHEKRRGSIRSRRCVMNSGCLRRAVALALTIGLSACTVGADFQPPAAPTQGGYDRTEPSLPSAGRGRPQRTLNAAAAPAAEWWHAFASPDLDDTIAAALEGSPTLEAAQATLAAANENVAAARGQRWPQADLASSASHGNGGIDRRGGRSTRDLY